MKPRLPGHFGGESVNNMMKKVQKMQAQMNKIQEELNNQEFTGTSGGGAVSITMLGNKTVKSVKLDHNIVNADDIEMLEDLIVAAFNQVTETIDTESNKRVSNVTGGLPVSTLF